MSRRAALCLTVVAFSLGCDVEEKKVNTHTETGIKRRKKGEEWKSEIDR